LSLGLGAVEIMAEEVGSSREGEGGSYPPSGRGLAPFHKF